MEDQIIQIIIKTLKQQEDISISPATKFQDLPIDSLLFVSLIVSLETKFNIEFDSDKLFFGEYSTVQDLIDYIEQKSSERRKTEC